MKILLLGCNGQVGWELQRSLMPLGQLSALSREGLNGLCGDLANPEGVAETVEVLSPDVIVNAAAYTAVDLAESDPDQAKSPVYGCNRIFLRGACLSDTGSGFKV